MTNVILLANYGFFNLRHSFWRYAEDSKSETVFEIERKR